MSALKIWSHIGHLSSRSLSILKKATWTCLKTVKQTQEWMFETAFCGSRLPFLFLKSVNGCSLLFKSCFNTRLIQNWVGSPALHSDFQYITLQWRHDRRFRITSFQAKGKELYILSTLLYPVLASISCSHWGVFRISQPNPRDTAPVASISDL